MSQPCIGDAAPDVRLLDAAGGEVALSSHWSRRPLVLLLLRHLG